LFRLKHLLEIQDKVIFIMLYFERHESVKTPEHPVPAAGVTDLRQVILTAHVLRQPFRVSQEET